MLFRNDFDGVSYRHTDDHSTYAISLLDTAIDERRRDKGASPIMDRHDFTIWVEPIESPPNRFLSGGSSRLQDPGPMAEIWIACDQPLARSQLFVSDH